MKISDYLPNIYNKNIEMLNIISSEETELEEKLKPGIESKFIDTFPNVATEDGIAKFEKILSIKSDVTTEQLEFRRKRILERLKSHIPFTESYFIEKMNGLLGEGNWTYIIDYNNYTLDIESTMPGRAWYQEVLKFIEDTIPCNILWTISIYAASWEQVYENFSSWKSIYDDEMTWQDVMDGEWLN